MATLVCIAYGVGVDFYQIIQYCTASNWSIRRCINAIKEFRSAILVERYLKSIDQAYDNQTQSFIAHTIGINCINCRKKEVIDNKYKMIDKSEFEEFIDIENANEAFEVISNKVSMFTCFLNGIISYSSD